MDTSKLSVDEINKQIAGKIMGWHFVIGNWENNWQSESGKIECNSELWNPCQKIDQAFQVVEKMREKGYYVKICSPFFEDSNKWYCYFDFFGTADSNPMWISEHCNPARAICEAALKATE